MTQPPSLGQTAPDFTLPTDSGQDFTLSHMKGKNVVVYFYPKDSTPGCTTQAIAFSDHLAAFAAANTCIIGISKDSLKRHQNFVEKQSLKITLGSDAHTEVCEQFGVWKEKSMYGKTYMGIERSTFLIDTAGTLVHEWRKVKVPGHVEQVLAAAQALEDRHS